MKKQADEIIRSVIYPETGKNIEEAGMVESVAMSDDRISVTLVFEKSRDPFMIPLKKELVQKLTSAFPQMEGKISVILKEGTVKKQDEDKYSGTAEVKNIVAIASGKGGVGKSTVTSNLAVTLQSMGYKVGVLDADIYGPSQPKMFGLEGYVPEALVKDGREMIIPANAGGIKIMSVGFFISPEDALIWRGPMATGAVRQLIHQTEWGALDFLLIDLPPGTGDIHLTIINELKINGAVIVSTPQQIAVADVVRGISMFRAQKINIPVLGIIENMAWFTPEELPGNRYYIFGKGGAADLANKTGVPLLGEIPIIQSIMEGADSGRPITSTSETIKEYYLETAENIVENLK